MISFRKYDEEKRLDRVWYESTNIVYSECDDKEDSLKTLRITFKNGSTYQYNNVDVNDYVAFLYGGLDGSNGRALNKIIKPKYEFEKLDDLSVDNLLTEMKELKKIEMPEDEEPEEDEEEIIEEDAQE